MVNYYVEHKNADDSVVEYIKNKLESSDLTELIIIQIELLYTDPSVPILLSSFIIEKPGHMQTSKNSITIAFAFVVSTLYFNPASVSILVASPTVLWVTSGTFTLTVVSFVSL